MFNQKVTETDEFLDMPTSSQLLYFHLNMNADDDWFVGAPKKIIRICWCKEDDFKLLALKNFILTFESGVCVIRHRLIHNAIRKDRYTKSIYSEESDQISKWVNNLYLRSKWAIGNQLATNGMRSIEENSIEENSIDYMAELKIVFEKWNKVGEMKNSKWEKIKWFQSCRKITDEMISSYKKLREDKKLDVEDITQWLTQYYLWIKSQPSDWDHRFSLYEFLKQKNWLLKFYQQNNG